MQSAHWESGSKAAKRLSKRRGQAERSAKKSCCYSWCTRSMHSSFIHSSRALFCGGRQCVQVKVNNDKDFSKDWEAPDVTENLKTSYVWIEEQPGCITELKFTKKKYNYWPRKFSSLANPCEWRWWAWQRLSRPQPSDTNSKPETLLVDCESTNLIGCGKVGRSCRSSRLLVWKYTRQLLLHIMKISQ